MSAKGICSSCGKKVRRRYRQAHEKFHQVKTVTMIVKAARGLRLHVFDRYVDELIPEIWSDQLG